MEFSLSSEQEMIIDSVRNFVEQELYPHEDEVEKTNHIDASLAESIKQKAIELGLYAPNYDKSRPAPREEHADFCPSPPQ